MEDDEIYKILGYVMASEYRINILKSLCNTIKVSVKNLTDNFIFTCFFEDIFFNPF